MPIINTTGQEKSKFRDWREVQDLIFMNMFAANPSEERQIRDEIKKFIEEERKNVRKNDQRDND